MSKSERVFSVLFGSFLLGVGIYVLLFVDAPTAWRIGGGVVLSLFGGNMVYAAARGRASWLSRIGPLP